MAEVHEGKSLAASCKLRGFFSGIPANSGFWGVLCFSFP
jgi:hypothetical protein